MIWSAFSLLSYFSFIKVFVRDSRSRAERLQNSLYIFLSCLVNVPCEWLPPSCCFPSTFLPYLSARFGYHLVRRNLNNRYSRNCLSLNRITFGLVILISYDIVPLILRHSFRNFRFIPANWHYAISIADIPMELPEFPVICCGRTVVICVAKRNIGE